MGRPPKLTEQKNKAYEYYGKGFSAPEILEKLELKFNEPASRRQVFIWVKRFKSDPDNNWLMDKPFEWHALDLYKIPWEASNYLMEIWRLSDILKSSSKISARHIKWCWRIHLVDSSLNKYDVFCIAYHFVMREIESIVQKRPVNFLDLESWLKYRPWSHALDSYLEDIKKGLIPILLHPKQKLNEYKMLEQLDTLDFLYLTFPTPAYPDWLPSSIFPNRFSDNLKKNNRKSTGKVQNNGG